MSSFDIDRYRELLEIVDHAYVLEADGSLQAFVIAYTDDLIDSADAVGQAIRRRVGATFVLIKQVCVAPESMGRGYARTLYDVVRAKSGGLPRYAAVVLEPPNSASVAFHECLGFRSVLEVEAPDGMPRGVWAHTGNHVSR